MGGGVDSECVGETGLVCERAEELIRGQSEDVGGAEHSAAFRCHTRESEGNRLPVQGAGDQNQLSQCVRADTFGSGNVDPQKEDVNQDNRLLLQEVPGSHCRFEVNDARIRHFPHVIRFLPALSLLEAAEPALQTIVSVPDLAQLIEVNVYCAALVVSGSDPQKHSIAGHLLAVSKDPGAPDDCAAWVRGRYQELTGRREATG